MSTPHYDCAVIGLGAAGSAALNALAVAGARVIGIDQFDPPHAFGSSHGETRLLRTAYSEGTFYVPMIRRAIRLWRALERRTGATLFEQTGVVYAGPRDDPFLKGAQAAAKRWRLALAAARGMDDWFALPADWLRLNDKAGGFVRPERAIAAFLKDARAHGAAILRNAWCEAIETSAKALVVRTSKRTISADRVIVATGAWSSELLPALKSTTFVERRVLHWFEDCNGQFRCKAGFRPFAISTGRNQLLYGFPANRRGEVKIAEHDTVQVIAGPHKLDRGIRKADVAAIAPLVKCFLPGLGRRLRSEVCMYPMSGDEHFILDRHPNDPRIVIGAGLSGHGFKFAPAIGEVLANFALESAQKIDVGPFALSRRTLRQSAR